MKKISLEIPDTDERGVSPVIGVILMVAITVILAAVIASFVLGFGDSVQENVQAGADIEQTDDGNGSVTWISEGNAVDLNVTVDNSTGTIIDMGGAQTNATQLGDVGETVKITSGTQETVTVTVTAIGSSGTKTVVSQEEIDVGGN